MANRELSWQEKIFSGKPLGVSGTLGLGGSVLGAIGSFQAGMAQYRGLMSESKQALRAAKETEKTGKYEAWRINLNKRQVLGKQRATYAALGLDVGEKTPTAIDNLAEAAKMLTLDRLMSIRTSRIAAYEHRQDAKNLKRAAKAAKTSGILGAVGSFF